MQITETLTKEQFTYLKKVYKDYFTETNFDDLYSDLAIDSFATKKTKDTKRPYHNSKYYFAIDNNEIVGFINGKIINDIGLICHVYVNPDYRNKYIFLNLFKQINTWFKDNNISTIEIEVNHNNPILKNIEKNNWHLYREFDDANVYQRNI